MRMKKFYKIVNPQHPNPVPRWVRSASGEKRVKLMNYGKIFNYIEFEVGVDGYKQNSF